MATQLLKSFVPTRMHSSRMRTTCLLPISPSMHCSRRVYLLGGYLPGIIPAHGGVPAQGVYLPWGIPALGCTCQGVPALGCTCSGVYLLGGYLPEGCTCPGGCTWCTCLGCTCWGGGYMPRYSLPCEQNS